VRLKGCADPRSIQLFEDWKRLSFQLNVNPFLNQKRRKPKMDIKETSEKTLKVLKSQKITWSVIGATVGLMIGVMGMHAWFATQPSWTPYVYPQAPVPPSDSGVLFGGR
jgi:hypothetical protein